MDKDPLLPQSKLPTQNESWPQDRTKHCAAASEKRPWDSANTANQLLDIAQHSSITKANATQADETQWKNKLVKDHRRIEQSIH